MQQTNSRTKVFCFRLMGVLLALAPLVAMAHGISEEDRQRMLDGGYMMYIGLGASHMLTGYDHLLFLFGVVFFLTAFRDVAKDKSKETLYMFFTSTGNFIAANFTGQ